MALIQTDGEVKLGYNTGGPAEHNANSHQPIHFYTSNWQSSPTPHTECANRAACSALRLILAA